MAVSVAHARSDVSCISLRVGEAKGTLIHIKTSKSSLCRTLLDPIEYGKRHCCNLIIWRQSTCLIRKMKSTLRVHALSHRMWRACDEDDLPMGAWSLVPHNWSHGSDLDNKRRKIGA